MRDFCRHRFKHICPSVFDGSSTSSFVRRCRFAPRAPSRWSMQAKLFHHAVDNSFLGGGVGQEPLSQAAEKSQKLRDDDIYRQVIVFAKLTQSPAFYDFITLSNRGTGNVFTNDEFEQPELLAIQF